MYYMVAKKSNSSELDAYKRPATVAYQPDNGLKPNGDQTYDRSSD
jgi:hypothetical protein